MDGRTILVGISPDTHKPFYVRPLDEPLAMKWEEAMEYAANLETYRKPAGTFRLPTKGELNMLFENRARINNFDERRSTLNSRLGVSGVECTGMYWSSTLMQNGKNPFARIFDSSAKSYGSDAQYGFPRHVACQIRLVRD